MSVARKEERLRVSTDGTAGPYIIVPVSLLDSVLQALSEARISFTVDEDAVSLGGQPAPQRRQWQRQEGGPDGKSLHGGHGGSLKPLPVPREADVRSVPARAERESITHHPVRRSERRR